MPPILFPHEKIRPIQDEMINTIITGMKSKKTLILNAPTGLGKTAASIAPTIGEALENGRTIFFLTSRNTQHKIALDTIRQIKEKHGIPIQATDIIGKKWMCIQPGAQLFSSNEFNEYCKSLREEKQCPFFENIKNGENLSTVAEAAIADLQSISPASVETTIDIAKNYKLCPYEVAQILATHSHVIVTDYYYIFHPQIREMFFKKAQKTLENSIVIVDEAHNLPNRIKDLASMELTSYMLQRAHKETKKYKIYELEDIIYHMTQLLSLLVGSENESYVEKDKFFDLVNTICDYHELIDKCHDAAAVIHEHQKLSFIGTLGDFLKAWLGSDNGFTRIVSKEKRMQLINYKLSYRCLDPSIISSEIANTVHDMILMSGTLTPTSMYQSLLGLPKESTIKKDFPSPFPPENRLNLIISKTTTKFTQRSENQYINIANILSEIIETTPGNSAIFFPSYYMKEQVVKYIKSNKPLIKEKQRMSRNDREELLENFKNNKKTGASLLAVTSGSFGEGIDLPGDELKTVVIVGLPLAKPDLETKALIEYYNQKFSKGWDYGYIFPAFNKVIQSAGRCIRSETDKGAVIFLDERYGLANYYRCFPRNWKMKLTVNNYTKLLNNFFEN